MNNTQKVYGSEGKFSLPGNIWHLCWHCTGTVNLSHIRILSIFVEFSRLMHRDQLTPSSLSEKSSLFPLELQCAAHKQKEYTFFGTLHTFAPLEFFYGLLSKPEVIHGYFLRMGQGITDNLSLPSELICAVFFSVGTDCDQATNN